jgi:hypothetical protein
MTVRPSLRAVAAALALTLAGCAGESTVGCRSPGEGMDEASKPLLVTEALGRQGAWVVVEGEVFVRDGRPSELCTFAIPGCEGSRLKVAGYRDALPLQDGDPVSDGTVGPGRLAGRVDGDTLRHELTCRAYDVQKYVGDAIGEAPTFNQWGSPDAVERLDYGSLSLTMPSDLRQEYGYFGLYVGDLPGFLDLPENEIVDAIHWHDDHGDWYAVKRYGEDVAVAWFAGSAPRLDERWERLDRVLIGLPRRS